jgi:hypothetical protein
MYTVKMQRGLRTKVLHTNLSANNARVIVSELRRLDKVGKFLYSVEPEMNARINYRIIGSEKTVKECRPAKFEWWSEDGSRSGIATAK